MTSSSSLKSRALAFGQTKPGPRDPNAPSKNERRKPASEMDGQQLQKWARDHDIPLSYKLTDEQRRKHPNGPPYRFFDADTLRLLYTAVQDAGTRTGIVPFPSTTGMSRDSRRKLERMSFRELQKWAGERNAPVSYKTLRGDRRFFNLAALRAVYAATHDATPGTRTGPSVDLPKDLRRIDLDLCHDGSNGKRHYDLRDMERRAKELGIRVRGRGGDRRWRATICKEMIEKAATTADDREKK